MPRMVLALSLIAAALPSSAGAQAPVEDELFARALELTEIVTTRGCSPRLLGSIEHPFAEAPAACDVFLSLALASMSVDRPERRVAASAAIERLFEHALSGPARAPFRSSGLSVVQDRRLPRSILYRGYLLAIAASLERAGGSAPFADALADSVADELERSPQGWLPSFGRAIWPCDHAPAAAGLLLRASDRRDARATRWRAAGGGIVARLLALGRTRFATRVDAHGTPIQPFPRGTALAFTAGFLLHADRAAAAEIAEVLARDLCDSFGSLAACREWPRGVERRADSVSGPIDGGYGAGASALAIGATRALDDSALHERLVTASHYGGVERYLAEARRYPLENAIYVWARSARALGI